MTPVEFRGNLWHKKTRIPGVSCGVVCVILRLAVLVELRLVTDRQTDRRTDGRTDRHSAMASTADAQHRAVKINVNGTSRQELSDVERSVNFVVSADVVAVLLQFRLRSFDIAAAECAVAVRI